MVKYRCVCGHWASSHDDELGHGTGCLDCGCTKTHQDVMNDPGSERVEEDGGGGGSSSGWMRKKPDGAYAGRQ